MDALKDLNFCIDFLGFDVNGNLDIQVFGNMMVTGLMFLNNAYLLVDGWSNIDERFLGVKMIVFMSVYFAYSITMITCWKEFYPVVYLVDKRNFKFPYKVSKRRQMIMHLLDNKMKQGNNIWKTIEISYIVFLNVPAIVVLIKITVLSQDIQKVIRDHLSTPFPLYFPEFLNDQWLSIVFYLGAYATHFIYSVLICTYTHLAHVTVLCAMADLEFELRLLRLSLTEMNELLRPTGVSGDEKILNEDLKQFFKYFVQHHQDTYRRHTVVNRGIKWILSAMGTVGPIFMCMAVYTSIQKDQMVIKIQEGLFFSLWAFGRLVFDSCGERIKIEDERLRMALYECPWQDKPKWFKYGIWLATLRNYRPIEIQPFGLFNFNLNSFAKTMNAVYSYYNLLNSVK